MLLPDCSSLKRLMAKSIIFEELRISTQGK
jgi:hypothetical protein